MNSTLVMSFQRNYFKGNIGKFRCIKFCIVSLSQTNDLTTFRVLMLGNFSILSMDTLGFKALKIFSGFSSMLITHIKLHNCVNYIYALNVNSDCPLKSNMTMFCNQNDFHIFVQFYFYVFINKTIMKLRIEKKEGGLYYIKFDQIKQSKFLVSV